MWYGSGTGGIVFGDRLPARRGDRVFSAVARQVVEARHGLMLDVVETSDATEIVAAFGVVAQAVAAAAELHAVALQEDPAAEPGFGVGFGEYMTTDRGGFGSAVIEAVRLQHRASGQVVLGSAIRAQLPPALQAALQPEGQWTLKGFDTPVDVWSLLGTPRLDATDHWWPVEIVMSVDIVGSTELLGAIGGDAAVALHRDFGAMVTAAMTHVDGQAELVDQRGDGAIVSVATSAAAVDMGLHLQAAVRAYRLRSDTVAPFEIRVGIAAGSQSPDAGVAAAVALESAAAAGEVRVDDTVKYLARDVKFVEFVPHETSCWLATSDSYDTQLPLPPSLSIRRSMALVGRDREIAELTERWQRTLDGVASFAAVVGESGIGKTRLVAEFAQAAADDGARVLFGWSDGEWQEPFGPFFEALAQSDEEGPDLRQFAAQLTAQALHTNDGDRLVFFDEACRQLRALTRERPVVLVLDDLHWATPATVSLLRYVMRQLRDERLFVVGTYRPGGLGPASPVHEFEAELRLRTPPPARLDVGGLSNDSVAALLAEYTDGDSLGPDGQLLAERVYAETDGSPFFARELLSHLSSGGALAQLDRTEVSGQVARLPVPESLRDVVQQRVARLDASAPAVLAQASVIGERFSLELLAPMVDTDIESLLEVVEKAEQASLLTEADRPREYRFAHAIVRSTLLDGLSATRRSLAHERIGVLLEEMPGDHIDQLTYHWQQAGGNQGPLKAAHYLQLAARRDAQALDWESAASRYRALLEMIGTAPDRQELVVETWLGLGQVLRALGDPEYLEAVKTAGRLARGLGNSDLLARAAIGAMKPGSWFANSNETDEIIIGFCEEAAQGLNPIDPMRVRLLAILATNLAFEDGRDRRQAYANEAVELAHTLGDSDLLAAALVAEHLALWDPTTFDRRGEIAEELERLARRRDDTEIGFLAGFFRASWLLEQGRVGDARECLAGLEDAIASTGNFWFRFLVDRMTIGLGIATGEPAMKEEVDALFERAAATQADAAGTWAAQLGGLAINAGQFGTMTDSLQGAAERSRGQGIWSYGYVVALIHAGDADAAREAAAGLQAPNLDFMWLVSLQFLAEVGYGLADAELSRRAFDALLPYRGRLGVIASGTLTYDLVSTSLGAAALGMGEPATAVELLEEALAHAEREGLQFPAARIAVLLSEARAQL